MAYSGTNEKMVCEWLCERFVNGLWTNEWENEPTTNGKMDQRIRICEPGMRKWFVNGLWIALWVYQPFISNTFHYLKFTFQQFIFSLQILWILLLFFQFFLQLISLIWQLSVFLIFLLQFFYLPFRFFQFGFFITFNRVIDQAWLKMCDQPLLSQAYDSCISNPSLNFFQVHFWKIPTVHFVFSTEIFVPAFVFCNAFCIGWTVYWTCRELHSFLFYVQLSDVLSFWPILAFRPFQRFFYEI